MHHLGIIHLSLYLWGDLPMYVTRCQRVSDMSASLPPSVSSNNQAECIERLPMFWVWYTHILLSAHCKHGPIWEKFYHHLCYCHVLSSEMIKMKVNFMQLKFLIIHFYFDQERNFYFMLSFKFTVCSFQISSWSCQSGPICFQSEVFDVDCPVSNCPKWKHFFTITIELCQAWSSSWVGISVIRNLTTDS